MERFNVVQFFADDTSELVVADKPVQTALKRAVSLATSVGAQLGTTKEVIITDSAGDQTNWHWKHGEGLIFPSRCANAACGIKGVVAGALCDCGTQTKPMQI